MKCTGRYMIIPGKEYVWNSAGTVVVAIIDTTKKVYPWREGGQYLVLAIKRGTNWIDWMPWNVVDAVDNVGEGEVLLDFKLTFCDFRAASCNCIKTDAHMRETGAFYQFFGENISTEELKILVETGEVIVIKGDLIGLL